MTQPIKLLFLDTSLQGVSVAVHDTTQGESFTEELITVRGQAEHIIPMVGRCLQRANLAYADLTHIVCTSGPGSFTGLRLALSVAKSLSIALDVPVKTISTFKALYLSYEAEVGGIAPDKTVCLIETKRSDYYMQIFDKTGGEVSAPDSLTRENIKKSLDKADSHLFIGDAVGRYVAEAGDATEATQGQEPTHIESNTIKPDLVAIHCANHIESLSDSYAPIYLRGADVSQPKNKPRHVQGAVEQGD